MSWDEENYLIFHVGGHFIKDPYGRYVGGEVIRLKEDLDTISYFELCNIVKIKLGFHTVMLVYFHEPGTVGLQNNLRVISDDIFTINILDFWVKFKEIHLYVEHEVDNLIIVDDILLLTVGESDVEGVEADEKGDVERVDLDEDGVVEGVQVVREGDVEGVNLDRDGIVEGVQAIGKCDVKGVEVYGEGDIEGIQADGEGDVEGVQAEADEYGGGKSGRQISLVSTVGEDNDSGFGSSVGDENAVDFATSDGVDNDSKQFKSTIRNYSKECRRQLKFLKNEPKKGCCEEHHCMVSFKKKIVTTAMIAQHFEATIKDQPKMKLREIQIICALEMHINVSIDCCYRAKKIVKDKMVEKHKEEFGQLWDYVHELRLKMPGSIIKMVVQRSGKTTRSMTTSSSKDGSGQTSSTPKSPNNKRKAPLDYLGTQESVAGNMNKS
ncbi:hypothetical protein GOBAR_DD24676 [Gossypium barbadense]|nr:hypothetical protein GOBAR_DD24676 [Gossypium barbadense]